MAHRQREVAAPYDFTDLDQVGDRLRRFEDRCNATAQPFQWTFTTSDPDGLPARLGQHTVTGLPEESSTALAA
ncbi:hypothetical protein AB0E81_10000 [Streptomyces sp. NPDC033538]|uniref:hypothetical protein n=1 Tax=Streptomyces sp. NPDC033538 TaxID=3155367 RepID=UPI0033E1717E